MTVLPRRGWRPAVGIGRDFRFQSVVRPKADAGQPGMGSEPRRPYFAASARVSPMILGNGAVEAGSGFAVSAGSIALATASGKRAFISRRKPSSVSTPAAILAIAANSALEAAPGLLAVSNAKRSVSELISGANFSRKRASPILSSANA